MSKHVVAAIATAFVACAISSAQNTATAPHKPMDRVIGTVTAVDPANHTVTVKEDKTGTQYTVELENAKTLLKVAPGAKDLTGATRISANDLTPGDRVQVGGSKGADNAPTMAARSVILMSARDLQQLHREQSAAWQHSTPGVVTAVDASAHSLNVSARTPEGPKPLTVSAANAQFTRYAPETPNTPVPSQLTDIQPGDQIRIIGDMNADGSTMTAQRIYSSSFRTVVGTVSSVAPDGKEITIKNLQTKQAMTVKLSDAASIHRLPPMVAYMLARRFNPDFRPPQGAGGGAANGETAGNTAGAPPYGAKAGEATAANGGTSGRGNLSGGNGTANGAATEGGMGHAMRGNGDLSQMLDRLPKITAADLKPGDAVVVSGSPTSADKNELLATTVIAGVEPIFQSASPRQAQSLGDWGAALSGGGDMGSGMPGGPPQ